jgi:hypothetical protein
LLKHVMLLLCSSLAKRMLRYQTDFTSWCGKYAERKLKGNAR